MKNLILLSLCALISTQAFAARGIKPCNGDMDYINHVIKGKSPEQKVYNMLNTANQIVGVFITDNDLDVNVIICDGDTSHYTSASDWSYWNSDLKPDPKIWKKNSFLEMSQDEGKASIKVLTADNKGNVKVVFSVIGWNGELDNAPEAVLLKDTLKFVPRK